MDIEDRGFNLTVLLGAIVGSCVGYHKAGLVSAVDGAFIGFAIAAICAALLAELSDALWPVSAWASRMLQAISPLVTLGLLIGLATRYWA